MKLQINRHIFGALALLAMLAPCAPASAHLVVGSLLKPAAARDVHQITCPDAGARLEVQVRDNAPVQPPVINVLVEKDGVNQIAQDKKDGDAKASPLVALEGGAGDYVVSVFKTAASEKMQARKEIYTLIYHCLVESRHTETRRIFLSNQ